MSTLTTILAVLAIGLDLVAIFYVAVLSEFGKGLILFGIGAMATLTFIYCDTLSKAVFFVLVFGLLAFYVFRSFKKAEEDFFGFKAEQEVADESKCDE